MHESIYKSSCVFRGGKMAAIEKAINDFFNSGSLKAAAYRANAIFGFSSKVIFPRSGGCKNYKNAITSG